MIKRLLLCTLLLMVTVVTPAHAQKYGYLGTHFVAWTNDQRYLYVAGVLDALDSAGVRCPVVPTYQQIIDETLLVLYRNPSMLQQWAAKSIGVVIYNRGCVPVPPGNQ